MINENYILMCEQAEEIQSEWVPKNGDSFIYKSDSMREIFLYRKESGELGIDVIHKIMFYLPTQEQLQEMILPIFLKRFSTTHALRNDSSFIYRMIIEKFQRWINRSSPSFDEYMAMFNNLTELWLAFVMHEKYNKIWTGEKWEVKEC